MMHSGYILSAMFMLNADVAATTLASSDTAAGQHVFASRCVHCHQGGTTRIRTPVDQIPVILQQNQIRQHRFNLDDAELKALLEYLKLERQ